MDMMMIVVDRRRTSSINGQKTSVLIVMEGNWRCTMCHKTNNIFTCHYCGVLEIINLFVVINFRAFSCFIYLCCMHISPPWTFGLAFFFRVSSQTHSTSRYATNAIRTLFSSPMRNSNYSVSITIPRRSFWLYWSSRCFSKIRLRTSRHEPQHDRLIEFD